MKNQTEILKLNNVSTTISNQPTEQSTSNTQTTKATLKLTPPDQSTKQRLDKTPHIQILSKTVHSGKLIRINSAKGINIISVRPTSIEKQSKPSPTRNNLNSAQTLQATIKLDDNYLHQQMKDQLSKTTQIYHQKLSQQLLTQQNIFNTQISKLNQIFTINSNKLIQQQLQLNTLLTRVQTIQKKVQKKIYFIDKQLIQFKKFYQQCYSYTLQRISELQKSIHVLLKEVDQTTSSTNHIQAWKYVQQANILIKNIIVNTSAQTSMLKYHFDSQIYQLQIALSKFYDQYQKLDNHVYEMQQVQFGNQSLRQYINQLQPSHLKQHTQPSLTTLQNHFQQKFQQTAKTIKDLTIQLDLLQTFTHQQQSSKIQQLQHIINTLQQQITKIKPFQQKYHIVNKQKLFIQSQLHSLISNEEQLKNQIMQLKLNISNYQTKLKNNQKSYQSIATSTQIQWHKFEEQKAINLQKITSLQQQIAQLSNQNTSLTTKQALSDQQTKQHITQLTLKTAIIDDQSQKASKLMNQLQQLKKQLLKINKSFHDSQLQNLQNQSKINLLLSKNSNTSLLLNQLQTQRTTHHQQLQQLLQKNKQFLTTNNQLLFKNNQLSQDLAIYAETFQKQSITFRTALEKLKKQNDFLLFDYKRISQQNNALKINLNNTKLAQSFYGSSLSTSLHFKNSQSPQLSSIFSMKKLSPPPQTLPNKIDQLRNILQKLCYTLPALCQIDGTGYLKDEKTGCYLMDQNNNCFYFNQQQLTQAVQMGLIML